MPVGLSGIQASNSAQTIAQGLPKTNDKSWDSLVKGLDHQIARISNPSSKGGVETLAKSGQGQLVELLKMQVDMHRCQVKVELLSKVSESATATFRKLEQGQ